MTQEEKAKRYDEALERAKSTIKECGDNKGRIVMIESIFPELRVSEDEKVRKALIEMVHDTTGDSLWIDYNIHKEEALAWLEKQGATSKRMISAEAKEAMYDKPTWGEEDEAHINSIIDYLLDYKLLILEEDMNVANGVQKELDWLETLKQRIGG